MLVLLCDAAGHCAIGELRLAGRSLPSCGPGEVCTIGGKMSFAGKDITLGID